MFEHEIKMFVPTSARDAVSDALAAVPGPEPMRLRAMYFDTADRRLANRKAAIRLRKEGPEWVQTFKMAGADDISRLELNHARSGPELDLSVYAGTPAQSVVAKLGNKLELCYETDVLRLTRTMKVRGSTVEVVYDVGAIRAGKLELPIHEVEFELTEGNPRALLVPAASLLEVHGLILDARSKAERGDALAQAWQRVSQTGESPAVAVAAIWEAVGARGQMLSADISPEQALLGIGGSCYAQIVRNAAILAGADDTHHGGVDHVHQVRVGIRRLRSAWRLFRGWTPPVPPKLQKGAKHFFGALGETRERDVLIGTVVPALRRAGMPQVNLPVSAQADAGALIRSVAYQRWQLDLLAWTCGLAPVRASDKDLPTRGLKKLVGRRLRKWHRRLVADSEHFADLSDEARHQLRKRAKRLRYGLTFTQALFPAKRVKKYRRQLVRLQDILGEINDLVQARARYADITGTDAAAWFAVGWTTGRLDALYRDAEVAFEALDDVAPFWK